MLGINEKDQEKSGKFSNASLIVTRASKKKEDETSNVIGLLYQNSYRHGTLAAWLIFVRFDKATVQMKYEISSSGSCLSPCMALEWMVFLFPRARIL